MYENSVTYVVLDTTEKAEQFIKKAKQFIPDINIYKGHNAYDAKSYISVINNISTEKLKVVILCENKNEVERFKLEMKDFM